MKSFYKALIMVFLFTAGCNNNNIVTPSNSTNNVIGKILIGVNTVMPYENIKVQIGDKTTYTDAVGNFTINDVTKPYDLYILDSITNLPSGNKNKCYHVFKNLNLDNLHIFIPTSSYSGKMVPRCAINVSYYSDSTYGTQNGAIKYFTDGKFIDYRFPPDSNVIRPGFFMDNNPITGKLILLCYTINNGKRYYIKYAKKIT